MQRRVIASLFLYSLFLSTRTLQAQQPSAPPAVDIADALIPMRDGVKLHAKVLTPRQASEPLPILMLRTAYGVEGCERELQSSLKDLAADGYVFVFEDIRGRFGSEGTFVMQRPARRLGDDKSIDEGTDTYDTIDWLLKNVGRNNGRVGMLGISYDGWTTIMAALEPHPALKAISPQASPSDMWLGDDFHHNGAFRLSYGFEYAAMMETSKTVESFQFDRFDTFEWYLRLGPLASVNEQYLHEKLPTWNDYVAHPDYDAFWQQQTVIPHLTRVRVPTLNVAGWWDQEDFYGPLAIYQALEKSDDKHLNYLVVGPWNHGGWAEGSGDRLGPIAFGSATAEHFRQQVQATWFAYWLKDKGKLELPEALTFEAGSNQWRRWDSWPPPASKPTPLYLQADGGLRFAAPTATGAGACDSFVADPAHPVPYRQRPIQATYSRGSTWSTWLTEDQRFVQDRADVLGWSTPPLDEDLTIAGEIVVHLFASTTGSDADWIVKLIDGYPEDNGAEWKLSGYELMVANEVFRGRYRNSVQKPEPIPSNQVVEFTWSLHTQDYTWKKGHRIAVQVQSSWFPLIDRNPQTFVPNIFAAKEADFVSATHKVFASATAASHLVLPIVPK